MDPRHCSIPRNVVAAVSVSGVHDFGLPEAPLEKSKQYIVCILMKNGRSLIVQSEDIPPTPPEIWEKMDYDDKIRDLYRFENLLSHRVSLIASVIDTIDFDNYQYAFLVSDGISSQHRLVCQNPANITPFSASLGWLPRVQESDIEVIQWMNDRVRCIWNYRHVEVFVPYSFSKRFWIQQMIDMLYLFEKHKLDITFEPLAIVTRGSEIRGIMMAQTEGRPVEMRDRKLLYEVVSKMHEANIVYQNLIGPDFVLIHNNKLRFTQCIHSFVHYNGDKDEDRLRWENTNWEDLDQLFKIIPRDNDFPIHVATHGRKPTLLNYISSPEHFFLSPSTFVSILEYMAQNRTQKSRKSITVTPESRSSTIKLADVSSNTCITRRKLSYHPYHSVIKSKTLLLTVTDDDIPSTLVITRRKNISGSRVTGRAGSTESDRTLVDADDATIVGDNDKWMDDSKPFWQSQ